MAILFYFLKVIICSALFAGCYWFVLRNERFHHWNRFFILGSVVLSVVIPLLNIPVATSNIIVLPPAYYIANAAIDPVNVGDVSIASSLLWQWLLLAACLLIALFFIVRETISIIRIVRLKRKSQQVCIAGANVFYTDDETAPFTFFRTIFWKKEIPFDSSEGQCMLRHELAHVHFGHSWDKALMQLVCCIFWMNPFFLLLRRELELVHEFAADHESIEKGNIKELSSLILYRLYPNYRTDFTSHFFQSPIKRRIVMITDNKKTQRGLLRKISVVPVVIISLYLFSIKTEARVVTLPASTENTVKTYSVEAPVQSESFTSDMNGTENRRVVGIQTTETALPTTSNSQTDTIKDVSNNEQVFIMGEVENMPQFNGQPAEQGFRRYVAESMVYPGEAQDKGIDGIVVAEFIIKKDGSLDNLKIVSSVDPLLDNEVLRVISASPKWTPGKHKGNNVVVKLTFPVVFKISH